MRERGYALGNLGSLCEDLGDFESARNFYLRRWENAILTGMQEEKIFAAGNLGILELVAGRSDHALAWYSKKLTLSRESKSRDMEAQALTSLSMIHVLQDTKAKAWEYRVAARKIYRELSRSLPLRFRLCAALFLCPKFLLPAAVAVIKRLQ